MDNLDTIIHAALGTQLKPEAALISETIRLAIIKQKQKKEDKPVIYVTLILSMLAAAFMFLTALRFNPAAMFITQIVCFVWICALITLFMLVKDKFKFINNLEHGSVLEGRF